MSNNNVCAREVEIAVLQEDNKGFKSSILNLAKSIDSFKKTFAAFMIATLVSMFGSVFYLGGQFNEIKHISKDVNKFKSEFNTVKSDIIILKNDVNDIKESIK